MKLTPAPCPPQPPTSMSPAGENTTVPEIIRSFNGAHWAHMSNETDRQPEDIPLSARTVYHHILCAPAGLPGKQHTGRDGTGRGGRGGALASRSALSDPRPRVR